MSNNKKIIASLVTLFFISAIYLSWVEKKQADLDLNKNWWVLSFFDPKSNDLSFKIENHSQKNNFHWEEVSDSGIIREGDLTVANGESAMLDVQKDSLVGKIIVRVSNGTDKKEIYKVLPALAKK
jgi:hypothetical protein